MPGFSVSAPKGPVGGLTTSDTPISASNTQYYYTYTWEVFNLFETTIDKIAFPYSSLIHVKDLTLPTFTANTDSYVSASLEYKWAKSVVWEDVKISWYDTKGLLDVMKTWRNSVWSPEEGLRAGGSYKKESLIDVHLPTWEESDSARWKLVNSWPKTIKHGELTYTNSDVKLVEVTIAYDWAEENPTSAGRHI